MIFLVALVLSVVLCVQTVAIEIVEGNTVHVRHGREPKAGVALFPMVPLYQLIALGLAWGLQRLMPDVAMAVLLAIFSGLFALWVVSYRRAKAEYQRLLAASR
ncbi:hypothetical protein [Roseateles sp. P5_E4]